MMHSAVRVVALSLFSTLFFAPLTVHAESCEEKFTRLLVEGNGDTPVKIHITQAMKGGMKTVNEHRSDGQGNWITEMINPATMHWSMARDNVMYSSADQGKTWTKVREYNHAQNSANAKAALSEDAKTARDVTCGEEAVDGVAYEKVSGTYTSSALQGAENTNAYWLDSDGWIARHTSHIKSSAFEMVIEQVLEAMESVEIPTP